MRIFESIDDLQRAVGAELGASRWRTVDQEQITDFAAITDDEQWIHVDQHRAAHVPFGSTIAHGYLLLALVPSLLAEVFRIDSMTMVVNYGLDRVRFPSPVPSGSRIRAAASLAAIESTASGHRLTVQVAIEADGSRKPSCVADALMLVVP